MDPYPSIVIFLLLILLSSLLTAGRTALTQLRDSSVKKMASSERGGERFIARLLEPVSYTHLSWVMRMTVRPSACSS